MERKGNLGISLAFYPVVAFLLAIFGQWLMCLLVLGLVMIVEKDEWATRQCMQAFFLSFIAMIAHVIIGFFGGIDSIISGFLPFNLTGIFSIVYVAIEFIIYVPVFVFALIGLLNVAKGKEANVPLISGFAYKAYGKTSPKRTYNAPNGNYYQQPMGQPYMGQQGAPMPQQGAPMPQQGAPMPQQGTPMPQQGAPMPQQGAPMPQQGAPMPPQGAPAQNPFIVGDTTK